MATPRLMYFMETLVDFQIWFPQLGKVEQEDPPCDVYIYWLNHKKTLHIFTNEELTTKHLKRNLKLGYNMNVISGF